MIEINQTTNINGAVKVDTGEKTEQVAFLTASVNVDGTPNSGRTIQNMELFMQHKNEVEKDFSAFDDYVYEIAEGARKKWEDAKKKEGEIDAESAQ